MSSVKYLVTRCHGLKTRLIPSSTLMSLVKVDSVESLADALLKTDYGNSIREIPWDKITGFTLERIFARKLVERYYFLPKIVSSRVTKFLYAYYRRFEIQNIRHILRGKVGNLLPERLENSLIPIKEYSSLNFNALINSKNAVDAVRILAETLYFPPESVFQSYEDGDSLIPFETYFEKVYARELMKTLNDLPEDVDYVNRLLRVEFDVQNTISTVSGIVQGMDSSYIESLMIPYSYRVSIRDIMRVIHSERDRPMIMSVFSPYERITRLVLAGRETDAFVEGFRFLYEESQSLSLSRAYSLAFLLTYLISCEIERRNLTNIALGKEYEVDPPEIRSRMIL